MSSKSIRMLLGVTLLVLVAGACAPAAPTQAPAATSAPTQAAAPSVSTQSAATSAPTKAAVATTAPAVAPTQGAATPKRGGTVTIAYSQEPPTLNHYIGTTSAMWSINAMILEGLVTLDPDGNFIPRLAETLPTKENGGVSDDGKTITFKHRKGVKWSDGTAFTCDDVVFTWKSVMTKESGAASTVGWTDLDSITCTDPDTTVAKFKNLYSPYLALFRNPIMPKSAGDPANMQKWAYNRKPVGTGPFQVQEWASADHITLVRNPNYREQGKPYLDSIIVKFVPSVDVGLNLLKSGQVDVMWNLSEAVLPIVEKMSGIKSVSKASTSSERLVLNLADPKIDATPDPLNNPHPILGDLRVRQAMQFAINKQQISDTLLFGKASVATSDVHAGWATCELKPSEFSLDKAKQLLTEAGWVPGADGIRVAKGAKFAKDGTRMRLKYQTTSGDKLREDTQQIILDQLKQIGVEVYIENVPSDVLFGTWASGAFRRHGQFDIIQFSPNPDIADPHSHMYQYYDSAMMPMASNKGAGANYSRWVNKEADKAIEQAGGILDLKQRHDLYCQSAQLIANELPVIFLYNRSTSSGYSERVQNFVGYNASNPDFGANAANWWLK